MADICGYILEKLSLHDEPISTLFLSKELNKSHQKIIGAVKSLETHNNVIKVSPDSIQQLEITKEGKEISENGSYEANVYNAVPLDGISYSLLSSASIQDDIANLLQQIQSNSYLNGDHIPKDKLTELKKRKLVLEKTLKIFILEKGDDFTLTLTKEATDLTKEMILDESWKSCAFKEYNFIAQGLSPKCGYLHPLMKVRSQFRQIFLEMGFTEMKTNQYIESSFWNFDSLFQPQDHPARDEHDTFFLSDPKVCHSFPEEYLERVKDVHSNGGYGSLGYRNEWKLQEAEKNVLRTHTTAATARTLHSLASKTDELPAKFFSIDKVFRNESLDATHLAEFHQIEGVIIGNDLTLSHLLGTLSQFFNRLGITKLRYKPTYNPYTEPSVEVYSFHEGLKKWVELGNSGIFRPEMLRPMGFDSNVVAIAWGLSLERPTMIMYGISNIRDLYGHKIDLNLVHTSPICLL